MPIIDPQAAVRDPGPMLERRLRKWNLYIPPRLMDILADAVLSIELDAPGRLLANFRPMSYGIERGKFWIKIPTAIIDNQPLYAEVKKYITDHNMNSILPQDIWRDSDYIRLHGKSLVDIMEVFCELYVNPRIVKNGEQPIPYRQIIAEETAPKPLNAVEAPAANIQPPEQPASQPAVQMRQQPQQLPGQQQRSDGSEIVSDTGFVERVGEPLQQDGRPAQRQQQQQQQQQQWGARARSGDLSQAGGLTRGGSKS